MFFGNDNMKKKNCIKRAVFILILCCLAGCGSKEESKGKYMEQGKVLMEQGRYEKALLAFKNILQIDPKNSEAFYQMAEIFSKQGDIAKAFGFYRNVMSLDEKHVMSRVRTGQLFLLSGNVKVAEQLLQELVTIAPNNIDVLLFQAGIDATNNKVDVAVTNIKKVLEREPDRVAGIVMLASIYAKKDDQKAISLLKEAEATVPKNESIHLLLAQIYNKKRLKTEVENELKELIKIKPQALKYYKRLSSFYISEKREKEAEQVLRRAVINIAEGELAQIQLVDFLSKKRGVDVAIVELKEFIKQKPTIYPLRFKLFSMQLNNEDSKAAEATLKDIIELDKLGPAALEARNTLARYYVTKNKADEAKQLMEVVLSENPRDADALILRGQFALSEDRVLDAIADFRAVLVGQPDNIKVLRFLSVAQQANNDYELAIENLERVVEIAPQDIESKQKLIELLVLTNSAFQAEQHINSLLKIDPKNKKALGNLFKIKLSKKKWSEAQEIASRVEQLDKTKGLYMSGVAYQIEGAFAKSVDAFKQTLIIKPNAVEPLTRLIKSYLAQNQLDQAISFLNKMVKRKEDNFVAYNLLGELYLRVDKGVAAEKAFQKSVLISPKWFNSYRNLGQLFTRRNDLDAAKRILQEGFEKTNASLELTNDLAVIYQNEGNYDEVIKLYDKAYEKHPNSEIIVNNLASYIAEHQATEENLARAEKMAVMLENSKNPNMLDTAAWVAYKQGHYKKAQKLLETAIELGANSPEISYHLGMAYYKQGHIDLAKVQIEKALSSKFEFMNIEQARRVLKEINEG